MCSVWFLQLVARLVFSRGDSPRSQPGTYCQDCAESVGIVDEILRRSEDAGIEIPPEAG